MLQPSNHLGGIVHELVPVSQHLCFTGVFMSAG